MGYNKNQYQKVNDKKVLHKVKKHWVVISLAMLMAMGGTAAATHVSAHADTTNNNNQTDNTQTIHERINNNLTNTQAQKQNPSNVQQNKAQSQSLGQQANALHQRIIQNAAQNSNPRQQLSVKQPKVQTQAPQLNADLTNHDNNQVDNTNNGRNQQASKQAVVANAPTVGDNSNSSSNSTNGTFVMHYINKVNRNDVPVGKQVGESSDSYTVNKPFNIQPYLKDLPAGFELDNDNNQNKNFPSKFQSGTNDLDIDVQPIPAIGKGYIAINYLDDQNNNQEENSIVLSGSDGTTLPWSKIQQYLQTPPTGYNILNYNQSKAGGLTPHDYTFSSNMQNVNIEVTPIYNPLKGKAQGSIIYENSADGDAQVSVDPFNETAGSDVDLTSYKTDVPSGYKLDKNNNPYEEHTKWTNGDKDIIYIVPNGTNPNVPKAQPDHSFVHVEYKDIGSTDGSLDNTKGQIVNSIDVDGTDGNNKTTDQAFDYGTYNNLIPNDYSFASDSTPGSPAKFPSTDGATANAVIDVKLNAKDNPHSNQYDPSDASNNAYATAFVQYQDVNTHNPITAMPDKKIVAKAGSLIDYLPLVSNIVSGYKFAGMGPHADFAENSENADHPNVIYLQQINTTAQPITVNYINQDGEKVGQSTVNGTASTASGQATHKLESDVNVTTMDGTDNLGKNNSNSLVPGGYSINQGENVHTTLTNNPQTLNILVNGNQLQKPSTFKFARKVNWYKNGAPQGQKSISDYTDTIAKPIVGQHLTISAADVAPAGYTTDPNQTDVTAEVQADGNFKTISPKNNAPAFYTYTEDDQGKNVKPITVEFFNQMGVNVPDADGQKSFTLNGSDGQTVNADYSNGNSDNGKVETPTNYSLVPNINTHYQFTDNPQTVQILVTGNRINHSDKNNRKNPSKPYDPKTNPAKNQINVHEVVNSDNGSQTYDKVIFADGKAGDKIQITPSNTDSNGSDLTPENYHATPSDQDYNVTLNGDGTITAPGMNADHDITYNYTKNTGNIKIAYTNSAMSPQYAKQFPQASDTATGEIGSNLDTNLYLNNLPKGFVLTPGSTPTGVSNFTAEGNDGTYYIPVSPAASMTITYKDATTGVDNATQVGNPKTIEGIANSKFTLPASDTTFVPSGYSYDSDAITNGSQKTGVSDVPAKWADGTGITIYVKKNPNTPINVHTGTITIHYVDNTDNTNDVTDHNPSQFEKTLTLNNNVNSTFTPTTYENMVPSGYTMDNPGNIGNISKFLATPQTAYVYVHRTGPIPAYSNDTIEYDDINNNDKAVGSTIPITGKTGSTIDYTPYESSLPSGYEFVSLGNADNTYNDNEVEHILVAKPAPAFGTVTVNYYSDNASGKRKLSSDTITAHGHNGSSFDMSNYENSLPTPSVRTGNKSDKASDYYTFNSASDTGQNDFIDYYNGGNQTLNIHLKRNHQVSNFGVITVNYIDKNNPSHVVSTTSTGQTGDVFDIGPYEHQAPENAEYVGIKGSIPAIYPKSTDTTPNEPTNTLNLYVDYND